MYAIFRRFVSSVAGQFSRVFGSSAAVAVAVAAVDEEMQGQARQRNQHDNTSGGTTVQTAAAGWIGYAITLAINLPKAVEPHLRLAYDAHVAFLCLTFFAAVYTSLHYLFKEETETEAERRRGRKMMVLISVSAAVSFALRIYIAAASWWRVLLITAVAALLGLLYLRPDVSMIS